MCIRDRCWVCLGVVGSLSTHNGELLIGYKEGSSYYLRAVDEDNKASFEYESLEYDMGSAEAKKLFQQVKVVTEPLPQGTTLAVEFRSNKDQDWTPAKLNAEDSGGNRRTTLVHENTGGVFSVQGEAIGERGEVRIVGTPSGNTSPRLISYTIYSTVTEYE